MKTRIMVAVAGAAFAMTGNAAVAQGANEDVRCLLASNLFTKAEKDPAKRQVAVLASYFYLGRVDGQLSGQQLANALKSQAPAIKPESAGGIMTACAKRLRSAGMAIQTLGKQLDAAK